MTQWLDYDLTDSPAQQTGEKKKNVRNMNLYLQSKLALAEW